MAAEKENNIIFDFTWGNTYGLFAEGYHVMIKGGGDLYLTWSVDLKYGETPIDNAKLDEFIKDLKALKLDSWNGRTYSDSGFENSDTWKIEVNHITLIMESKGANDYPPEWKQFLEYLHVKWSVPVSSRELPAEERLKLQKKREKEEQELRASQKAEKQDKTDRQERKDNKKRSGNNNGNNNGNNDNGGRDRQDNRNKNKDRQGNAAGGKKKEQVRPHKDNSRGKDKDRERDKEKDRERDKEKDRERRRQKQKMAADNENGDSQGSGNVKSEKPRKFRYYRKKRNPGSKDTKGE